MTIRLLVTIHPEDFPPFSYGFGQDLEHFFCSIPTYARICDTDTVLQTCLALLGHLLSAYPNVRFSISRSDIALLTLVDIAFNHDAHNALLSCLDLSSQVLHYLWLISTILQRVTVTAVDH